MIEVTAPAAAVDQLPFKRENPRLHFPGRRRLRVFGVSLGSVKAPG